MKHLLLKAQKQLLLLAFTACFFLASAQCPRGTAATIGNVVVNGDFDAGNTGFTSEYNYCNSGGCLYPERTYAVGSVPYIYHNSFSGSNHSGGALGKFMIINGAGTPNTNVWCQTITVTPNTLYLFETWVSTMVAGSPARLQFSINGTSAGPVFTAPAAINSWQAFNATWTSGSSTTATICIVNQNTALGGNDFGLDDISFSPCTCNFKLPALSDTTVCQGNNVQLSVQPGADSYRWTSSATISCDTCSSITVNPSSTATFKANAMMGTCQDSVSVVVNVQPQVSAAWTAPAPLCSGEKIVLSSLVTGTAGGEWAGQGVVADSFSSAGLSGNISLTYAVTSGVCSDQATHDITVSPGLSVSRNESICPGGSLQLPWGATVSKDGAYQHTYSSGTGCDSVVTVTVSYSASPSVAISADKTIFCSGDSTQLCADRNFISYGWNEGATTLCTVAKQAGNYYVTVSDINNCTAESDAVGISIYPVTSVNVLAQGPNLSSYGANSYQWLYEGNPVDGANSSTFRANQSGSYSVRITDENGCVNTSAGVYVLAAGIEDLGNGAAFGFYPNPATNLLNVIVSGDLVGEEMAIYDVSGKLVLRHTITSEYSEISLAGISTGVYFLKIASGVKKLVVQ